MLALAAALPATTACNQEKDSSAQGGAGGAGGAGVGGTGGEAPARGWTFMVYMIADNNLEPFALLDMAEMMDVGQSDDFHIVVQADRAEGYTEDGVADLGDWTTAKRLRIADGAIEELGDIGEINTGDAGQLTSFIEWAAALHPAENYALVFWDHGGAWPGFGGDRSRRTHDSLTLAELSAGLTAGMTNAAIERFAFIGFDACLMSTFETAIALRPYAGYLLASEELEPGHGWDYHALQALRDDPTMTAPAVAHEIIAGFKAQAIAEGKEQEITLAVTDLGEPFAELETAVNDFAAALAASDLGATGAEIARQHLATQKYGDSPNPAQATFMLDLGHLAGNLAAADPTVAGAATAVVDALGAVVLEQTAGPAKADATGLSIYFPLEQDHYNVEYDQIDGVDAWRDFLKAYFDAAGALGVAPTFVNANHVADVMLGMDGVDVSGQLDVGMGESVASAILNAGVVDTMTGDIIYIADQPADVDADLVSSTYDLTVLVAEQGTISDYAYLALEDEGGFLVAVIPFVYTAPGGPADFCQLRLVFDRDGNLVSQTYYLLTDGGPGELTPEPGSTLKTVLYVLPNGGSGSWVESSGIELDATQPIDFSLYDLAPGQTIDLTLEVSNFAGDGDYVFYQGVL
jgi:hypothetical protein